jgi:4-diphosphocytidyl-2-C-methyl-D-erythritol kinase
MIVFPNAKINLGLQITAKRPDGFHEIETAFYPVNWCDALEVTGSADGGPEFGLSQSGIPVAGPLEENIIYKAFKKLKEIKKIPSLKVHLHKNIPMGAGLGGGSSDAAFFINVTDELFSLSLSAAQKHNICSSLGSDCSFFLGNSPMLGTGRGEVLSPLNIDLSSYYLYLVYPGVHSNTAQAYRNIIPRKPEKSLSQILSGPVSDWKDELVNDFEKGIFNLHPAIADLKAALYKAGAIYASMSGSGSTVFGIFDKKPHLSLPEGCMEFVQEPRFKIL